MVEKLRAKGDNEGADTWLRIIAAITTLGIPPTAWLAVAVHPSNE